MYRHAIYRHAKSSLMAVGAAAVVAQAVAVEHVFNFTSYVSIENSILRPNGNILFGTLSSNNLYQLDPSAENPQAEIVATLAGATAITGFAKIGSDRYAIAGGVRGSFHYDNETIYTVDLSTTTACANANATVSIAATLPLASMLNGAVALSASPEVILLADSRLGSIWRVNTTSGTVDTAIAGADFLLPADNATLPIGANGLKIQAGYLYFTNTYSGIFGRIPIDELGNATGEHEVLATTVAASSTDAFDDIYVLSDDGASLICQAPDRVNLVSADREMTTIVGTGTNSTEGVLLGCSTIAVTKGVTGERIAYVGTKGSSTTGQGGQIIRIVLD